MTKSLWPSPDLVARGVLVEDLGPVGFVTTQEAARFLALSPHSLECYRAKGARPRLLQIWQGGPVCGHGLGGMDRGGRHSRTAGDLKRTY